MDGGKPSVPGDLSVPGLIYRRRRRSWVLSWSPRSDLQARGYQGKTVRLWPFDRTSPQQSEPTRAEWEVISAWCARYHAEQILWAHGGVEDDPRSLFDGTVGSLIEIYQKHPASPFKGLRYSSLISYTCYLTALKATIGKVRVADIAFADITRWQKEFAVDPDGGKPMKSRAVNLIGQLKRIVLFGALVLPKSAGCHDVCDVFTKMAGAKLMGSAARRRKEYMTVAQCRLLRAKAHEMGHHSVALEQAFAFELGVRQKDVIGEWIPMRWPGLSDVQGGAKKWMIGIRWEEIDENLILTHRLSKSLRGRESVMDAEAGKTKAWDLSACPMIVEEFTALLHSRNGQDAAPSREAEDPARAATFLHMEQRDRAVLQPVEARHLRAALPVSGPLIVCEGTGRPWGNNQFARVWRDVATAAGLPPNVQNRDSRPGAATEAQLAGALREDIQRQLGHSKGETTEIYLREEVEEQRKLAKLRVEKRK